MQQNLWSTQIPNNPATWLNDIEDETKRQIEAKSKSCNLPSINLLFANPLQRVIIAKNLEKLFDVISGENSMEPLRLLVQGYGGTRKNLQLPPSHTSQGD